MKTIIYAVLTVLLLSSVAAVTDNIKRCNDLVLEPTNIEIQGRGTNDNSKCHEVPEFSAIAAGIAATGASVAFIILRRKK